MQQTAAVLEGKTISDVLKLEGIRLGNSNVILREESVFERDIRACSQVPMLQNNLRLTMKFEDKSEKHFSVLTNQGFAETEQEAVYAVQEMVSVLKLGRVVWQIEGGHYHISSHKTKLPNRIFQAIKSQLKDFFFNDED